MSLKAAYSQLGIHTDRHKHAQRQTDIQADIQTDTGTFQKVLVDDVTT